MNKNVSLTKIEKNRIEDLFLQAGSAVPEPQLYLKLAFWRIEEQAEVITEFLKAWDDWYDGQPITGEMQIALNNMREDTRHE